MELVPGCLILQTKGAEMGVHGAVILVTVILLHVSEVCVLEQLFSQRHPAFNCGFYTTYCIVDLTRFDPRIKCLVVLILELVDAA